MLSSSRNQIGLLPRKIAACEAIWEYLGGKFRCPQDIQQAHDHGSRTRYSQTLKIVYLGADVEPGAGMEARVRMSEFACLAHELAHAERHQMGYDRPNLESATLIDEAETSLHASFMQQLNFTDRHDLIEDARDQITMRLAYNVSQEENYAN